MILALGTNCRTSDTVEVQQPLESIFVKSISSSNPVSPPEFHFALWVRKDVLVRAYVIWAILTRRETKFKLKEESTEDELDHVGS